ncbi:conserved hypothetical protein [Candidatus Terasakiella magnetica]|nr:conserved hypothetical protein [Candidatus Terasakiella magnetica]
MSTDELTITQAVAFAALYALDQETSESWKVWAHAWLKGNDRSGTSAQAAAMTAITAPARHAATAARLLSEANAIHTEGLMLAAENRNSVWHLDTFEQRNAQCLDEVAQALRPASGGDLLDPDSPRARELRAKVTAEF